MPRWIEDTIDTRNVVSIDQEVRNRAQELFRTSHSLDLYGGGTSSYCEGGGKGQSVRRSKRAAASVGDKNLPEGAVDVDPWQSAEDDFWSGEVSDWSVLYSLST